MAKYTFDSRSLSSDNGRHEQQMRSSVPPSGMESRATAPSRAKALVFGIVVAMCGIGLMLCLVFGKAFCGSAGNRQVQASVAKVSAEQVKAYLTPSEAEVEQLYRMVVTAPFVAENLQYRDRLKDIPFVYIATNDVVNAVSGLRVVEKDGEKGLAFHTVFFGGAARYARLVGLAAALQDAGHKDMLKNFVAAMPRRFCGRCDEVNGFIQKF